MKHDEAKRLVEQTFKYPFSKERYEGFISNLLQNLESPSSSVVAGAQLPKGFEDHIVSIARFGKYRDPAGDVLDALAVKLKNPSSLDRARTRQRNLMAHYLTTRGKDAALVAFYSDDSPDWRFSFVRLAYETDITEEGRVKAKREFTPARRFSFLVGETEPNHTAQQQLAPLLEKNERLAITDIEAAFNIESVTNEFFERYKELFLNVKDELDRSVKENQNVAQEFEKRQIDAVSFTKKLLGQIVFLYFIQKKGWLGVKKEAKWGEGDKDFLNNLFMSNYGKNYFKDILEPFFYEALALERPGDYYKDLECKVPFLNGGLFEPLNGYRWKETPLVISNKVFKEIFEAFNLYNFTVKEDEPLEKEVAVDPEMLGKVFENLLGVVDRKDKGTYYTPREIVHFMCAESLIEYLDSALNKDADILPRTDLEILIRHGDFLVENDLAKEAGRKGGDYLLPEKVRDAAEHIDKLLAHIKVCDPAIGSGAFPVGMMTEIVRARTVLSPWIPNANLRSSYNLKWHCIENSLYGVDIDASAVEIAKLRLWLSMVVDEDSYDHIRPLPNLDYRIVCGNSLLTVEKNLLNYYLYPELESKKTQYFGATNQKNKDILRKEIGLLIDQLTEGNKLFDFGIYFSEIYSANEGFDIAIANPLYGANIDKLSTKYAELYPSTTKQHKDVYKIFIECAITRILRESGTLCFILPNTLLLQPRYRDVREFLLKNQLNVLVNLGEEVFEQVVVPTCILIVSKKYKQGNLLKYFDYSTESKFVGLVNQPKFELISQDEFKVPPQFLFTNKVRKIRKDELLLDAIFDFRDAGINYQRTKVGLSEKGKSDLGQRLLYEGKKESKHDVEYWKGEDIGAFYVKESTNKYVRLTTLNSLRKNERVILNREYFSIAPKLIWRQTAPYPIAAIDKKGRWFGRSIQAATIKSGFRETFDLRYLLALLNSKVLREIYTQSVKEEGRVFPQVKLAKMKMLPIRQLTPEQQQPFIDLVEKIKKITERPDFSVRGNLQMQFKDYEEQLNMLVNSIYS